MTTLDPAQQSPTIYVGYEELPDGRTRVWAGVKAPGVSGCKREALLHACVVRAHPELVGDTARLLAMQVKDELSATPWQPLTD